VAEAPVTHRLACLRVEAAKLARRGIDRWQLSGRVAQDGQKQGTGALAEKWALHLAGIVGPPVVRAHKGAGPVGQIDRQPHAPVEVIPWRVVQPAEPDGCVAQPDPAALWEARGVEHQVLLAVAHAGQRAAHQLTLLIGLEKRLRLGRTNDKLARDPAPAFFFAHMHTSTHKNKKEREGGERAREREKRRKKEGKEICKEGWIVKRWLQKNHLLVFDFISGNPFESQGCQQNTSLLLLLFPFSLYSFFSLFFLPRHWRLGERHQRPSPKKPPRHEQVKEPRVLMHRACGLHGNVAS
jgi:hypothetical protein